MGCLRLVASMLAVCAVLGAGVSAGAVDERAVVRGAYAWVAMDQRWQWQVDVSPETVGVSWSAALGTWLNRPDFDGLALAAEPLNQAASEVAGRAVQLACAEPGRWREISARFAMTHAHAFALLGTGIIVLPHGVCRALVRVNEGARLGLRVRARAVAVLAHELGHTVGFRDERDASCWGIGASKRFARALGDRRPYRVRRAVATTINGWSPPYRCD